VVEQPIRNRQVVGSTPTLGSSYLRSSPDTWATFVGEIGYTPPKYLLFLVRFLSEFLLNLLFYDA
jgi:hypothetical protein